MNTLLLRLTFLALCAPALAFAQTSTLDKIKQSGTMTSRQQVERGFRLALSRRPNPNEAATCAELLARQAALYRSAGTDPEAALHQALVQLCHTLLNTSEFLYVE